MAKRRRATGARTAERTKATRERAGDGGARVRVRDGGVGGAMDERRTGGVETATRAERETRGQSARVVERRRGRRWTAGEEIELWGPGRGRSRTVRGTESKVQTAASELGGTAEERVGQGARTRKGGEDGAVDGRARARDVWGETFRGIFDALRRLREDSGGECVYGGARRRGFEIAVWEI